MLIAVGADAGEHSVNVPALPAACGTGRTVAVRRRRPVDDIPVLEELGVVGRRHGFRLLLAHRDVRERAPSHLDRRHVHAPGEVRVDRSTAGGGGVDVTGPRRLRAVAVVEEAQGPVPADANREDAEPDDGGSVDVGAAHAIVAGGDPGLGGDKGAIGVVDAEDVYVGVGALQGSHGPVVAALDLEGWVAAV